MTYGGPKQKYREQQRQEDLVRQRNELADIHPGEWGDRREAGRRAMTPTPDNVSEAEVDAAWKRLKQFVYARGEIAVGRNAYDDAQGAKAILRELLAARTSTAPVAWEYEFEGDIFGRSAWIKILTHDRLQAERPYHRNVRPLYASPPPPQPAVTVTEALERAARIADAHAKDAGDMAARGFYTSEERAARNTGRGIASAIRALAATVSETGRGRS